jgi:hypothetical protein
MVFSGGFAASKPNKEYLTKMAEHLAIHYVGGYEANIFDLQGQSTAAQDAQRENILLMHQCFLLYDEISFSMNHGDISRLETLFPPWVYLFRATGKHKYAAQMVTFMTDVHFVYPLGLK